MTQTPTLSRRRRIVRHPVTRPETNRALRDIAFVLAMTRRVGDEIRADAAAAARR
jgi:hypothetical protein